LAVIKTAGINPSDYNDVIPTHPSIALEKVDLAEYRNICKNEIPVDKFFSDLWVDGLVCVEIVRLNSVLF
jgi:hypothetical protein